MTGKIKRKVCGLVLLCCFLMGTTSYAATTQKKIDSTREKITDLKNQKEEAEQQVDDLNDKKSALESDLSSLNTQLGNIVSSMNELDTQIGEKQQEIEDAKEQLEQTQQKVDKQYADMKVRIQYMYENGNTSIWQILFESESVADFLNRTEYAAEINQYDRNMLTAFCELKDQIAEQKEALETELADLTVMEQQMQEKQESVNTLISNTKNKIEQSSAEIADAQSDITDIDAKIAKMKAYEKELEVKKAKEDAARLAAIKKQEQENTAASSYVPAESDAYLLGAIIECEAGGESYDGQLAVGSVIVNRVRSAYFPNTISGVIYQSGQFSPVASGRLAYRLQAGVSSSCLNAAQSVLSGNVTTSCLYFRANNGIISGMVIGNHVFY